MKTLPNKHIKKVSDWTAKWLDKKQISKKWMEFIINEKAVPGKNSTLYKTHKEGNPVRLLTAGNNTAIENLAIFVEKYCSPQAKEFPSCINDNAHLLDILDQINTRKLENGTMLIFSTWSICSPVSEMSKE